MKTRACLILSAITAVAAAQTLPATRPNSARDAFDRFVAAAKSAKAADVEALVFQPQGEVASTERAGLLASVDAGLFRDAAVHVEEARESADVATLLVRMTAAGRPDSTEAVFLVRTDAGWLVLGNDITGPVLPKAKNLTSRQKAGLMALDLWANGLLGQRRAAERRSPTTQQRAQMQKQSDLALAVMRDDTDRVRALVAEGVDINRGGLASDPPLIAAARAKTPDMLKLLLSLGAKSDPPLTGASPLMEAIAFDRAENARLLIEAGARLDRTNSMGDSPLYLAAYRRMPTVVKLLLNKGVKPNERLMPGMLLRAAAMGGDFETFTVVRPFYPDLTITLPGGGDALHFLAVACESRDRDGVRRFVNALLDAGLDPRAKAAVANGWFEKGRDQALAIAAEAGKGAVVDALLDRVEYTPGELTPLLRPLSGPLVDAGVLRKLIAKGASVRQDAAAGGVTPLHRAVSLYIGDAAKLTALLDAGHPLDPPTGFKNRTPLLTAVASSRVELVDLLLGRGANATAKDADGNDAVALARLRTERGREIVRNEKSEYFQDEGEAADEGQRILAKLQAVAATRPAAR